ncbi:MAG: Transposase for insertion sequence element, partial [Bacteroidota bacterium]
SLFPLTLSVPYENKKVERESLAELSTRFNLHPNMITTWKQDFIERSSSIFETDRPVSNFDDEREQLFAKIGRLEMERDWLKKMGLMAIFPKRNLSKLGLAKYIRPYLLRGLLIDRPNQVWAIDITYIPVAKGFLYLTAAMDVYSRYVVAWDSTTV